MSSLPSTLQLPQLMSRLGIRQGPAGNPAFPEADHLAPTHGTRAWTLDALAGRFAELASPAAGAALTAAIALVHEAQSRGEPSAWIAVGGSTFYPPDVAESGVDLDALPVVRTADLRTALRAADQLLRSSGFAVVVLDLGRRHAVRVAAQSRLAALAKKHRTVLLCLTRKEREAPSIGSLVTIRGEAAAEKTSFDRFDWHIDVVKDKRRGPGWRYVSPTPHRGPEGWC